MSRTKPTTSKESFASLGIEEEELANIAQSIACPECGQVPVKVVRTVAPEDAADETVESFKGGLGGALVGGIAGAPLGPPGVMVGMASGVLLGSNRHRKKALQSRLVVSCPGCDYHGRCE